jgi:hypothetical protein
MRSRAILLFCVSALFGVIVASAPPASALLRRMHATTCWKDNLQSGNFVMTLGTNNSSVQNWNSGSASLICPAADDSAFPKSSQVNLRAWGYDGNTSSNACFSACVTFLAIEGGACSQSACSSNGNYAVPVATTKWRDNPGDLGFLLAQIPGKNATNGIVSTFRGYVVSDTP